jgi:hypothetical protein
MNWCLVAICGILFIFLIWLVLLTIEFDCFKIDTKYTLEQMKRRHKLDQMHFYDTVWTLFKKLNKKRKVAKKK